MGYSKLTTAEIYDCTVQTIADVRTYGSTLVVPSVLFLDVTTKFGEYDISFKKLVKSDFSQQAIDLDRLRDRAVKHLYHHILSLTFSADPAVEAAANGILTKIETFGTGNFITESKLGDESAMIGSLLNDLARPEYASRVVTTGITSHLAQLKSAETKFEALGQQRREEKEEKKEVIAVSHLRKQLQASLVKLRQLINVMAITTPNSEWVKVNSMLSVLDDEYTQKLKAKATLAAKDKKKKPTANS